MSNEEAGIDKGSVMESNGRRDKSMDITWDLHHCSPQAEVVLVSKDQIGFRVDAWYLSKRSEFIKGLLDLPSTQSIRDAPIHVNQNGDIVRHFIDCVVTSKLHDQKLGLTDIRHMLSLCDHLQAPTVSTSILQNLKTQMSVLPYQRDLDAWEVFKLAAVYDDVVLAKLAIGCFNRAGVAIREIFISNPPSFFDEIPQRYILALLRCFANPTFISATLNNAHLAAILFVTESEAAKAFSLT